MERIVILGGGFAGLTAATELDPLAASGKAQVTLVERGTHFRMGFTKQWVLDGRRRPDEGRRPYASFRARHVAFLHDAIAGIDTARKTVHLKSRHLEYDHLVVALGAELAPELLPGLAEGAYDLFDDDAIPTLKAAVEGMAGGTLLVAVASVPFKCPPAPYEYALLLDDILRRRRAREAVRLLLTTPEPQPMPAAGKAVGEQVRALLAERGIDLETQHTPKAVDAATRVVTYANGAKVPYGILAAIPPHRAPKVVRDAGLTDASGFVPVELGTFRAPAADVYAVGDVAAIKLPGGGPHPKAGVFAEAQALALARALAARVASVEPAEYAGKGVCYVEVGRGMAAPTEISLLESGGPRARMDAPSVAGLAAKAEFERERFSRWFGG